MIYKAYFKGARITDIPTTWRGRTVGASKFKMIERAPKYLRLYFWALVISLKRSFKLAY